jgi:deoxycytidylate deaminase
MKINDINSKLDNCIEKLVKLASNSPIQYKHGACLLKGNKTYSFGFNRYIKEIFLNNQMVKFTVHAELDALYKLGNKNIKGMDILIIRIGKMNNNLKNSRPCNNCIEKMAQRGIRKVYLVITMGKIVCDFIDSMSRIHNSSGFNIRNKLIYYNKCL